MVIGVATTICIEDHVKISMAGFILTPLGPGAPNNQKQKQRRIPHFLIPGPVSKTPGPISGEISHYPYTLCLRNSTVKSGKLAVSTRPLPPSPPHVLIFIKIILVGCKER